MIVLAYKARLHSMTAEDCTKAMRCAIALTCLMHPAYKKGRVSWGLAAAMLLTLLPPTVKVCRGRHVVYLGLAAIIAATLVPVVLRVCTSA